MCKQYRFDGDLTLEVLASLQASARRELSVEDYGYFFNSKAEGHPELDQVSDKTRANAQPALFQIMRQCEMLGETNHLITQMISPALQNCSPEKSTPLGRFISCHCSKYGPICVHRTLGGPNRRD